MVKNLRMSRKDHANPRRFNEGAHEGGKAGNTGLDNGQMDPHAPKKHRPFKVYPLTPVPTPAAEDVNRGKEGPAGGGNSSQS